MAQERYAPHIVTMHITYRYGCPAWAELPAPLIQEMRLAHDLREELVAWDLAYDQEREAILRDASEQYRAAGETLDALLSAEPRDWPTINAARKAMAPLRKAAAQQAEAPLRELAERRSRKERYHAIRAAFCATDGAGLHWANWAITEAAHERAKRAMVKRRQQGLPAELHHHRWDGSGTIGIIQSGKIGDYPTSLFASGEATGPWPSLARLVPWEAPERHRSREGRSRLRGLELRVGQHGRSTTVTIPLVYHRPLPDGLVRQVTVTTRRVGPDLRASVSVVVEVPGTAPRTKGPVVTFVPGWKATGHPGIQIGALSGLDANTAPPDVAEWAIQDGEVVRLYAPAILYGSVGRHASFKSVRDKDLDVVRERIVAALRAEPALAESVEVRAGEVARWRSAGRLARLVRHWPTDHPDYAELEAWRQRDKHLWCYDAHESDQLLARRRDLYRQLAAWVARSAGELVIQGIDVAGLARKDADETPADKITRDQMRLVAPGELVAALTWAAKREGVPYRLVPASTEKAVDRLRSVRSLAKPPKGALPAGLRNRRPRPAAAALAEDGESAGGN